MERRANSPLGRARKVIAETTDLSTALKTVVGILPYIQEQAGRSDDPDKQRRVVHLIGQFTRQATSTVIGNRYEQDLPAANVDDVLPAGVRTRGLGRVMEEFDVPPSYRRAVVEGVHSGLSQRGIGIGENETEQGTSFYE